MPIKYNRLMASCTFVLPFLITFMTRSCAKAWHDLFCISEDCFCNSCTLQGVVRCTQCRHWKLDDDAFSTAHDFSLYFQWKSRAAKRSSLMLAFRKVSLIRVTRKFLPPVFFPHIQCNFWRIWNSSKPRDTVYIYIYIYIYSISDWRIVKTVRWQKLLVLKRKKLANVTVTYIVGILHLWSLRWVFAKIRGAVRSFFGPSAPAHFEHSSQGVRSLKWAPIFGNTKITPLLSGWKERSLKLIYQNAAGNNAKFT